MPPITLPMDTPVLRLPLSTRARNALHNAGKATLADVVVLSRYDLGKMKNVGRVIREEIHDLLLDLDRDFAPSFLDAALTPEIEVKRLIGRLRKLEDGHLAAVLWGLGSRKVAGPWEKVPGGTARRALGTDDWAGFVSQQSDGYCGYVKGGVSHETEARAKDAVDRSLTEAGWLLVSLS